MNDMPRSSSGTAARMPGPPATAGEAKTWLDLLYPGFYMVFLLRGGHAPAHAQEFRERVKALLDSVEQGAQRLHLPAGDTVDARFAFCALLDEMVLISKLDIGKEWACRPMQLELFGEHMAGERFFDRLECLRCEGVARLGLLEVFHMCLLLGFQGRYALEGPEKLDYLTARLGDEIVQLQGRRAAFAPHGAAPDRLMHKLQRETPVWAMAGVFAALALVAFIGMRVQLDRATERELAAYSDIVQLAPLPAQVTITLP